MDLLRPQFYLCFLIVGCSSVITWQRSLKVKNSDSETLLLTGSESPWEGLHNPHLTIIPGDSYIQASLGKLNYDRKLTRCCCWEQLPLEKYQQQSICIEPPFVTSSLTHGLWGPNNDLFSSHISYQENHTNKNSQQVGCAVSQSTVCSRWKLSSLLIEQQNPFEARRADDLAPPSVYRIQDQWWQSRFNACLCEPDPEASCLQMGVKRLSFSGFLEVPIFLLDQGSPASRSWTFCQISSVVWLGINCTININVVESSWNHPHHQSMENLSSMKLVAGARKVGSHCAWLACFLALFSMLQKVQSNAG